MITTENIHQLIAFLILNNKPGFIQAMNQTGNFVASDISDDDLLQKAIDVFATKGLDGIKNILSFVRVDKSKITASQKSALTAIFGPDPSTTGKFGDWFNSAVQWGSDLIGGHSTVTTNPTVVSTTPLISAKTIIWIAGIGIVSILTLLIVFRKSF